MRKVQRIQHRFVDAIPDGLEDGVLYVCIQYGTVVHKCFCGCQNEVVTPLTPTDWRFTFNGETVSLHPSVGSWSLKCRSHYWIKNDHVEWADDWSDEEVRSNSGRDRERKESYYNQTKTKTTVAAHPAATTPREKVVKITVWGQVRKLFR